MRPFWLTARRLAPLALVAVLAYTAGRQYQRGVIQLCSDLAVNTARMLDMYDLVNVALWAGLGLNVPRDSVLVEIDR